MTQCKRYSAEFKAKVALEAIREDLTTAELAKKYNIHPTMISGWSEEDEKTVRGTVFPTNTTIENMASAFGGASPAAPQISEKDVEKLHAKIGQLVVERDFLSEASSHILGTGGRKR